jgi:hypothetical protein
LAASAAFAAEPSGAARFAVLAARLAVALPFLDVPRAPPAAVFLVAPFLETPFLEAPFGAALVLAVDLELEADLDFELLPARPELPPDFAPPELFLPLVEPRALLLFERDVLLVLDVAIHRSLVHCELNEAYPTCFPGKRLVVATWTQTTCKRASTGVRGSRVATEGSGNAHASCVSTRTRTGE